MKQNIYDDPRFFEGYSKLRRHESGLNMAVDHPAIRLCVLDSDSQRVRAEAATHVGRIAQINAVRPAMRANTRGVGAVGREDGRAVQI